MRSILVTLLVQHNGRHPYLKKLKTSLSPPPARQFPPWKHKMKKMPMPTLIQNHKLLKTHQSLKNQQPLVLMLTINKAPPLQKQSQHNPFATTLNVAKTSMKYGTNVLTSTSTLSSQN